MVVRSATPASLLLSFDTSNRSSILEFDPHGEIVAINVEGDVDVLRVQIWAFRIVKAGDFAASQDEPTNGLGISQPALNPIAKVDCAEFVLVGSLDAIVAHSDEETRSDEPERRARTVASAVTNEAA
jgi:hypothetical protein